MFLPAEVSLWWDIKLLGSFAAVGSSGKPAQPGSCRSSMETPHAELGEEVGHSLGRLPLDFSEKHPQKAMTLSSWAIAAQWPEPGPP